MTNNNKTLIFLSNLMKKIGIPASIRGYRFLQQAILLALEDEEMLDSITKLLYPSIAKSNDTTPSRVERSMRHAIETAWERGDVGVLSELFGYTVRASRGKPTNSEFSVCGFYFDYSYFFNKILLITKHIPVTNTGIIM